MHLSSEVSQRAFQLLAALQDHEPQPRSAPSEGTSLGCRPQSHIQVPADALPFPTRRKHQGFGSRELPQDASRGVKLWVRGEVARCGIAGQDRAGHWARIPGDNPSESHPSGQTIKVTPGGLVGSQGPALPQVCRGAGVPRSSPAERIITCSRLLQIAQMMTTAPCKFLLCQRHKLPDKKNNKPPKISPSLKTDAKSQRGALG